MDQIWEQQNPQTKNKVAKYYQSMKKVTKFLVSFSLFSFFFSNPSWISLFLNSFILHLSNFPSQFLSLVHDKSYIFLLCNGILVFLAKYSTRVTNSSQPQINLEDEFFEKDDENLQPTNPLSSSESLEKIGQDEDEDEGWRKWLVLREEEKRTEDGEEEKNEEMMGEKRETKGGEREENGILDDEEQMERKCGENGLSVEVQKEKEKEEEEDEDEDEDEDVNEDEEGGITTMSTEELNRKFEEFIRKMKEDIRIEARRQLIMV
ncbi:hypothetical protein Ancab_024995 [Ancistrocladus abbreviatus]